MSFLRGLANDICLRTNETRKALQGAASGFAFDCCKAHAATTFMKNIKTIIELKYASEAFKLTLEYDNTVRVHDVSRNQTWAFRFVPQVESNGTSTVVHICEFTPRKRNGESEWEFKTAWTRDKAIMETFMGKPITGGNIMEHGRYYQDLKRDLTTYFADGEVVAKTQMSVVKSDAFVFLDLLKATGGTLFRTTPLDTCKHQEPFFKKFGFRKLELLDAYAWDGGGAAF